MNEFANAVLLGFGGGQDFVGETLVGETKGTTEGVCDQSLGESAGEVGLALSNAVAKLEGELTKADLEKVTRLSFFGNQLTNVKGLEKLTKLTWLDLNNNQLTEVTGLEKLTQLKHLNLNSNQLTDVMGLEKLTKLEVLNLQRNPDLTKAQIVAPQKALPKCKISY